MKSFGVLSVVLCLIAGVGSCCYGAVIEPARLQELATKVFNYQGDLPIKDDRTGEIINANNTQSGSSQADNEAICWNLIVEQTAVTFALQNKVLDELEKDLKELSMSDKIRNLIGKMTKKLRGDMDDATEALKNESPEGYFDALFATSEDIIQMSSLIRDPTLDDKLFMALVKAVSRLGRNNSSLIQDFIDQCSLIDNKSPQPRSAPAS